MIELEEQLNVDKCEYRKVVELHVMRMEDKVKLKILGTKWCIGMALVPIKKIIGIGFLNTTELN